jgi:hypothetical protein
MIKETDHGRWSCRDGDWPGKKVPTSLSWSASCLQPFGTHLALIIYDFSKVPSEIIAPYVSLIRLIVRPFPSLTSIFDFLTRS